MKCVCIARDKAVEEIAQSINSSLQKKSVLLLLSGGSNINLAVKIREKLQLTNPLCVGLIDERYGPLGHSNSNWTQLLDSGFNTQGIMTLPIITDDSPIADANNAYVKRLQAAIMQYDKLIGTFGIGEDGHTAGILPASQAINESTLVTHFTGPDFPRITITPAFMKLISKAFLISYGVSKHEQLERFMKNLSITEQPAQSLKQINNLTIYCDNTEICN